MSPRGGWRAVYDKSSATTADEVCALSFLAEHDALPPNPITPRTLQFACYHLPPELRRELAAKLAKLTDEGAGIRGVISFGNEDLLGGYVKRLV